jgi:RHS repeat-associated protein
VAHDSAGNVQKLNGWFFEYDSDGRMIHACQSTSCAGSITKIEYAYDGSGHRTQTKEYSAGTLAKTWDFRYQGDAIVEEKLTDASHPAGTVVRSYVVDEDGSIVKMTIPTGEVDAGTYLVTWNGHGDALALWQIDAATGALTLANSYTYTTWGAPSTSPAAGFSDLGFRFLYVGEYDVQWDNAYNLGLLYMHARHYSPALGRFLQPDPDASEANLYAYAANNPVTEIDPDGTCFIICAIINAVVDTAIYLATTDSKDWSIGGAATAAVTGAVTGFIGVGLLSKVSKIGAVARFASRAGGLADRAMFGSAQRVFWSGGPRAMGAATRWATSHGATTIGMTRAGKVISAAERIVPRALTRPVWRGASWMYARGARGVVHTFIRGRPSPTSIWRQTELRQLRRPGSQVTSILYHRVD